MCFDMFICVFAVFMSLVRPISLPAALRRPQKNHAPGFLEHVPCVFCRFSLLSAWCAHSACLRRFADLRKTTPLDFWSMYPVYLANFRYFQPGAPTQPACGASPTSEKTPPGILEHVSYVVYWILYKMSFICRANVPKSL